MRITQSVTFWSMVTSAVFGCIVWYFIHWIAGVIIFFMFMGKAAFLAIILDTVAGSLEYHHDRQDDRTKKFLQSLQHLKAEFAGARPVRPKRINKLII